MKILIATDAFKDALSAIEVSQAIAKGIHAAQTGAMVMQFPLADGGEGTADILTHHSKGCKLQVEVSDPLFRSVKATYGISGDGLTAFIEMAQASGIQLLTQAERNPFYTTTYGTGQLIQHAINQGVKKILLGIGSSATNDCGMGMASALGYKFWDLQGQLLQGRGGELSAVAKIDAPKQNPLEGIEVTVICDVENPLYGARGAAHTYGRQKGADKAMIAELDIGLRHFAAILERTFGRNYAQLKGAGAAGGMGAGTMAFLEADLRRGIDMVMDFTGFERQLKQADFVITGEGCIDEQTLNGKLIKGITQRAKQYGIPVIGICGTLLASPEQVRQIGLKAAFSILQKPTTLEAALANTAERLETLTTNIVRLF